MSFLKPNIFTKRAVACLLIFFFTLNSSLAFATGLEIKPKETVFEIPSELGEVSEFSDVGSGIVVHIRDAHGQTEAQQQIVKILSLLQSKFGFRDFFFEGGLNGPIPKDLLKLTGDQKANQKTAQFLMKEGEIGGPEVFLLEKNQKVRAFGVESPAAYKNQLTLFREIFSEKHSSDAWLSDFKMTLEKKASVLLNPDLLKFVKEWVLFQDSRSDILHHLNVLVRAAKIHLNLDLGDALNQMLYPQLVRFVKIKQLEKKSKQWSKTQIESDIRKICDWIQANGIDQEFSNFFTAVQNQKNDKDRTPIRDVIERFFTEAESKGFQFKNYPALTHLISRLILSEELDAERLFSEIDQLSERVIQKLAQSQEEKALIAQFNVHHMLRKLFALEMSRPEADQVIRERKLYFSEIDSESIQSLFERAVRFYEDAKQRDSIFWDALEQVQSGSHKKMVIVTGGFHSDGLRELAQKSGARFVEVAPRMNAVESNKNYLDAMLLRKLPALSSVKPVSPGLISIDRIRNLFGSDDATYHDLFLRAATRDLERLPAARSELRHISIEDASRRLHDAEKAELGGQLRAGFESALRSPALISRRFLDLGAGDGELTHRIADLFDETVAVEKSVKRTSVLRTRGIRKLKVFEDDFFDRFPSNQTFGGILISHSLLFERFEKRDALLKKALGLLASNGKLAIAVNSNEPKSDNQVAVRRQFMKQHDFVPKGRASNLEDTIRSWGYPVDIQRVRVTHEVSSADEMVQLLLGVLPRDDRKTRGLPVALKRYADDHLRVLGTQNQYVFNVDFDIIWVSAKRSELRSLPMAERFNKRRFAVSMELTHPDRIIPGSQNESRSAFVNRMIQEGYLHAVVIPDIPAVGYLIDLWRLIKNPRLLWKQLTHIRDPIFYTSLTPYSIFTLSGASRRFSTVQDRALLAATTHQAKGFLAVSGGGLIPRLFQAIESSDSYFLLPIKWIFKNILAPIFIPMNSFAILKMLSQMKSNPVFNDLGLSQDLPVLAVENPLIGDVQTRIERLSKKANSGAQAILTQPPIFWDRFQEWWSAADQAGLTKRVPIVVGMPLIGSVRSLKIWIRLIGLSMNDPEAARLIELFQEEEKKGAKSFAQFRSEWTRDLIRKIRSLPNVSGIHLMPIENWGEAEPFLKELFKDPEFLAHEIEVRHSVRIDYESSLRDEKQREDFKELLKAMDDIMKSKQFELPKRVVIERVIQSQHFRSPIGIRHRKNKKEWELVIDLKSFQSKSGFQREEFTEAFKNAWALGAQGYNESDLGIRIGGVVRYSKSPVWQFNTAFWGDKDGYMKAQGRDYRDSIKGSPDTNENLIRYSALRFLDQLNRVEWRRSEKYVFVEIGAASVDFAKAFIAKMKELAERHGKTRLLQQFEYVVADASNLVLEDARKELGEAFLDIPIRYVNLRAEEGADSLKAYRGRILKIHATNVFDNIPTDKYQKIDGQDHEVLTQLYLPHEALEALVKRYGLDRESLERDLLEIEHAGVTYFLDRYKKLFESRGPSLEEGQRQYYLFWADLYGNGTDHQQGLKLAETPAPLDWSDYGLDVSQQGAMQDVLDQVPDDTYMSLPLPALRTIQNSLSLMNKEGEIEIVDIVVRDVGEYREKKTRPNKSAKYDGSAVDWFNGWFIEAMGKRAVPPFAVSYEPMSTFDHAKSHMSIMTIHANGKPRSELRRSEEANASRSFIRNQAEDISEGILNSLSKLTIGKRVEKLRLTKGITNRNNLARAAKISFTTLLTIERRDALPSPAHLIEIAHALGVDPVYIMTGKDFETSVNALKTPFERFELMRIRYGYSQEELVGRLKKAGIQFVHHDGSELGNKEARAAISYWEKHVIPDKTKRAKIANFFNVDPELLYAEAFLIERYANLVRTKIDKGEFGFALQFLKQGEAEFGKTPKPLKAIRDQLKEIARTELKEKIMQLVAQGKKGAINHRTLQLLNVMSEILGTNDPVVIEVRKLREPLSRKAQPKPPRSKLTSTKRLVEPVLDGEEVRVSKIRRIENYLAQKDLKRATIWLRGFSKKYGRMDADAVRLRGELDRIRQEQLDAERLALADQRELQPIHTQSEHVREFQARLLEQRAEIDQLIARIVSDFESKQLEEVSAALNQLDSKTSDYPRSEKSFREEKRVILDLFSQILVTFNRINRQQLNEAESRFKLIEKTVKNQFPSIAHVIQEAINRLKEEELMNRERLDILTELAHGDVALARTAYDAFRSKYADRMPSGKLERLRISLEEREEALSRKRDEEETINVLKSALSEAIAQRIFDEDEALRSVRALERMLGKNHKDVMKLRKEVEGRIIESKQNRAIDYARPLVNAEPLDEVKAREALQSLRRIASKSNPDYLAMSDQLKRRLRLIQDEKRRKARMDKTARLPPAPVQPTPKPKPAVQTPVQPTPKPKPAVQTPVQPTPKPKPAVPQLDLEQQRREVGKLIQAADFDAARTRIDGLQKIFGVSDSVVAQLQTMLKKREREVQVIVDEEEGFERLLDSAPESLQKAVKSIIDMIERDRLDEAEDALKRLVLETDEQIRLKIILQSRIALSKAIIEKAALVSKIKNWILQYTVVENGALEYDTTETQVVEVRSWIEELKTLEQKIGSETRRSTELEAAINAAVAKRQELNRDFDRVMSLTSLGYQPGGLRKRKPKNRSELRRVAIVARDIAERILSESVALRHPDLLRILFPNAFSESAQPLPQSVTDQIASIPPFTSVDGFVTISAEDPIFKGANGKLLFSELMKLAARFKRNDLKPWITIAGENSFEFFEFAISRGVDRSELLKTVKFTSDPFAQVARRDGAAKGAAILTSEAEPFLETNGLLVFVGDSTDFDARELSVQTITFFSLLTALGQLSGRMKDLRESTQSASVLVKQFFGQIYPEFSLTISEGRYFVSFEKFWAYLERLPSVQKILSASA